MRSAFVAIVCMPRLCMHALYGVQNWGPGEAVASYGQDYVTRSFGWQCAIADGYAGLPSGALQDPPTLSQLPSLHVQVGGTSLVP